MRISDWSSDVCSSDLVDFAQPDRLAEMPGAFADREDDVAGLLEADADRLVQILDHADAADRGGRQDRAAAAGCLRFIVEADVARHDRIVERAARQDRKSTRLNSSH